MLERSPMGTTRGSLSRIAASVLSALSLCGCGSSWQAGDKAPDQAEKEHEAYTRALRSAVDDDQVIQMVWDAPAPEGEGLTRDWLRHQRDAAKGNVLFPRWKVRRQGSGICEVRYTFTLIDENNSIRKRGWAWKVDTALDLVSSPSDLKEGDFRARGPDGGSMHRPYKSASRDWSLE